MPKACGKIMHNYRKVHGITCAIISPAIILQREVIVFLLKTTCLFRHILPLSPTTKSTVFFRLSPLSEHKFYSVSTAPITTTTN